MSAPLLPVNSSVYHSLDLLRGHGLIPSAIQGIRPWTRAEAARQIDEARGLFEHSKGDSLQDKDYFLEDVISNLEKQFSEELSGLGLKDEVFHNWRLKGARYIDFFLTELDSSGRPYFGNNSPINGFFNPLVQNHQGRHLKEETQIGLSTRTEAQLSSHASFSFAPFIQFQLQADNANREQGFFVEELTGSLDFLNTQLDIGRRPLLWGQSDQGGVVLSNNARPLDGVFLGNPHPWKIHHAGSLKYAFFFTTLGEEQVFENAYFSGLKISYKPWKVFEVGIARALVFGGEGAPSGSFQEQFGEFFGIRPGGGDDGNLSNSLSGFELRGVLPFLRNTEIYSEFYFDDFNLKHIFRSFVQDSGIIGGIFLSRLDNKGTWSLRLEGRKMSPIMYQHGIWTDGWTLNGFVLGDPLGPDAESIRLHVRKIFYPKMTVWGEFDFERSDSDIYASDPSEGRIVAANGTPEKRYRLLLGGSRAWTKRITTEATLGYERVTNPQFLETGGQDNFLLMAGLTLNTDDLTRFPRSD